MKKSTRLTALLVTAGAVGLGGLAAVSPALAGGGQGPGPGPGPSASASFGGGSGGPDGAGSGRGNGTNGRTGAGMGRGPGGGAGPGAGMRDGTCLDLPGAAATGTLTEQQKTTLSAMAQEEKLAHDLYAAFADKYDTVVFDRIAASETRHLSAVRSLLERYHVADPAAGQAAGRFSDQAVQQTYDRLLAQGAASEKAAFGAARNVEQTDVDDLQKAIDGLTAPDVKQVYTRLLSASRRHLATFQAWAAR